MKQKNKNIILIILMFCWSILGYRLVHKYLWEEKMNDHVHDVFSDAGVDGHFLTIDNNKYYGNSYKTSADYKKLVGNYHGNPQAAINLSRRCFPKSIDYFHSGTGEGIKTGDGGETHLYKAAGLLSLGLHGIIDMCSASHRQFEGWDRRLYKSTANQRYDNTDRPLIGKKVQKDKNGIIVSFPASPYVPSLKDMGLTPSNINKVYKLILPLLDKPWEKGGISDIDIEGTGESVITNKNNLGIIQSLFGSYIIAIKSGKTKKDRIATTRKVYLRNYAYAMKWTSKFCEKSIITGPYFDSRDISTGGPGDYQWVNASENVNVDPIKSSKESVYRGTPLKEFGNNLILFNDKEEVITWLHKEKADIEEKNTINGFKTANLLTGMGNFKKYRDRDLYKQGNLLFVNGDSDDERCLYRFSTVVDEDWVDEIVECDLEEVYSDLRSVPPFNPYSDYWAKTNIHNLPSGDFSGDLTNKWTNEGNVLLSIEFLERLLKPYYEFQLDTTSFKELMEALPNDKVSQIEYLNKIIRQYYNSRISEENIRIIVGTSETKDELTKRIARSLGALVRWDTDPTPEPLKTPGEKVKEFLNDDSQVNKRYIRVDGTITILDLLRKIESHTGLMFKRHYNLDFDKEKNDVKIKRTIELLHPRDFGKIHDAPYEAIRLGKNTNKLGFSTDEEKNAVGIAPILNNSDEKEDKVNGDKGELTNEEMITQWLSLTANSELEDSPLIDMDYLMTPSLAKKISEMYGKIKSGTSGYYMSNLLKQVYRVTNTENMYTYTTNSNGEVTGITAKPFENDSLLNIAFYEVQIDDWLKQNENSIPNEVKKAYDGTKIPTNGLKVQLSKNTNGTPVYVSVSSVNDANNVNLRNYARNWIISEGSFLTLELDLPDSSTQTQVQNNLENMSVEVDDEVDIDSNGNINNPYYNTDETRYDKPEGFRVPIPAESLTDAFDSEGNLLPEYEHIKLIYDEAKTPPELIGGFYYVTDLVDADTKYADFSFTKLPRSKIKYGSSEDKEYNLIFEARDFWKDGEYINNEGKDGIGHFGNTGENHNTFAQSYAEKSSGKYYAAKTSIDLKKYVSFSKPTITLRKLRQESYNSKTKLGLTVTCTPLVGETKTFTFFFKPDIINTPKTSDSYSSNLEGKWGVLDDSNITIDCNKKEVKFWQEYLSQADGSAPSTEETKMVTMYHKFLIDGVVPPLKTSLKKAKEKQEININRKKKKVVQYYYVNKAVLTCTCGESEMKASEAAKKTSVFEDKCPFCKMDRTGTRGGIKESKKATNTVLKYVKCSRMKKTHYLTKVGSVEKNRKEYKEKLVKAKGTTYELQCKFCGASFCAVDGTPKNRSNSDLKLNKLGDWLEDYLNPAKDKYKQVAETEIKLKTNNDPTATWKNKEITVKLEEDTNTSGDEKKLTWEDCFETPATNDYGEVPYFPEFHGTINITLHGCHLIDFEANDMDVYTFDSFPYVKESREVFFTIDNPEDADFNWKHVMTGEYTNTPKILNHNVNSKNLEDMIIELWDEFEGGDKGEQIPWKGIKNVDLDLVHINNNHYNVGDLVYVKLPNGETYEFTVTETTKNQAKNGEGDVKVGNMVSTTLNKFFPSSW